MTVPAAAARVVAGPQRQLKILLTEGSSTSSREAIYALGPRHTIDILDPSPFCQCRFSRYVRHWYRCPSFARQPAAYLSFLIDRLRSQRYDVLLPTHEQVFLLSRFRDRLRKYAGVALPPFESLDRLIGKTDFMRALREVGLRQPEASIVRGRDALLQVDRFPCYVKLSHSTAGEGVRLVRDAGRLAQVVDQFAAAGWLDGDTEVLVQQVAPGVNGGVTGIFQNGRLVAVHSVEKRFENVGGWAVGIQGTSHLRPVEDLRRLGQYLDWHGALCLEYLYDAAGDQFLYIECNPRIAETMNATLSGVNLCEQLVRVSLDEEVEPLSAAHPGVRSHQFFLILMAKAWAGAGRRELVAEIRDRLRQKHFYRDSQDQLTRPREDWMSLIPALAVSAQLLASPRSARMIVKRTVDNYALSEQAVRQIRQLRAADIENFEP